MVILLKSNAFPNRPLIWFAPYTRLNGISSRPVNLWRSFVLWWKEQTQFITYEQLWDLSLDELHQLHRRLHERVYWNRVHTEDTCDDPEELAALVKQVEGLIKRRGES